MLHQSFFILHFLNTFGQTPEGVEEVKNEKGLVKKDWRDAFSISYPLHQIMATLLSDNLRQLYYYKQSSDRPTYLSADLYSTGILLSSSFSRLISELAERNSTKLGHMLGSNCDLKMHVQNLGYLFPL